MKLKRTLSLFLLLLLCICSFASCGEMTAAELEAASAKQLEENPYTMTMALSMSSDNPAISEMISQMNLSMKMTADGDAIKLVMTMAGETVGTFTYVDNCLYLEADGEKEKATATKEQFEQFYNRTMSSMGAVESSADMFNKAELVRNEDKTYTVVYTDLKPDAFKDLPGMEEAEMPDLSNVTLKINYDKKGICQKMEMSFSMDMSEMAQTAATVTTSLVSTFDYADVSVTAPADAASYTEFDINDLLG